MGNAIARVYDAAEDLLARNAGRAKKSAYIDDAQRFKLRPQADA